MTTQSYDGTPQALGQLINELVSEKFKSVGKNQQALSLWMTLNGERERAHTVATFLDEKNPQAPLLVVYVDSNACVVDFNASRELYLARFEGAPLNIARLDFRLSRYAKEHRERAETRMQNKKEELPELSDDERAYIDELVKDLPERLQASVSKAISSSMRRQKAESTQKS